MTFTEKMCSFCHDTGTTTKDAHDGYLDCTHCEAAERRAAFDKFLRERRPGGQFTSSSSARDWAIYKHAYALARAGN